MTKQENTHANRCALAALTIILFASSIDSLLTMVGM